ncbi:MAG: methyltransferase, partial [Candidatus Marinimicrobia bacterium]|nr:methyltransferase [Candidatus Neomarinimicrobiota bacterium]
VSGPAPEVVRAQEQKKLEYELIGAKIPGFFPTPRKVVDQMIDLADLKPGMSVLEPSAGKGDIAEAIKEQCPTCGLYMVEINRTLIKIIEAKNIPHAVLAVQDFLTFDMGIQFDRVIMNPPFENEQDIDHVRHAFDLLKPGGRLVAIMGEHGFFAGDKKAVAFRSWFDELGGESEQLCSGTFSGPGAFCPTGVSTRLITLDKPESAEIPEAKTLPAADEKLRLDELIQGRILIDRNNDKAVILSADTTGGAGANWVYELKSLTGGGITHVKLSDILDFYRLDNPDFAVGDTVQYDWDMVGKSSIGKIQSIRADGYAEVAAPGGYVGVRPLKALNILKKAEVVTPFTTKDDIPGGNLICNFGDWCISPDGKEGFMRGSGGLGSRRCKLVGANDEFLGFYNTDELKPKAREPVAAYEPGQQIRLFAYKWLAERLTGCQLTERDQIAIFGWRPLRNFISWAASRKEPVHVCAVGMVPGAYQITITGVGRGEREKQLEKRAKLVPGIKRVFTKDADAIYNVMIPESEKELTWRPQEINKKPAKLVPVEQASMFEQKAEMKTDPLLSAISCTIGVGCLASKGKKGKPANPVCSSAQKQKRESCILDVKAKLPKGCNAKEWNKPPSERRETCVNPFAVCTAAVGCSVKPGKRSKK